MVDAGDALLPMGKYVEQPIRMEIREGSIVSIDGGADSRLLKDFFELPKDKRAYGVSHIGWGYEHRANWNALGLRFWEGGGVMDTESYYGNMLIAFGANFFRKLGARTGRTSTSTSRPATTPSGSGTARSSTGAVSWCPGSSWNSGAPTMRLKDKVAVVTGSSRSIGRAIALGYAREGAKVVINYRSDGEAAHSAVAEIEAVGSKAIAVRADTSSSSHVKGLIGAAVSHFGRVDILVNNAAILIRTPFLEIEEAEWDRIIEVNLKGFFLCSQAAARQMVRQGDGGVIINMSSAGDTLAGRDLAHYCVAKGGVRMLTRQLAFELAPTRSAPTPSLRD